ncbi:hypothetical protein GM3709_1419 [Geminocystis sp. NIES-3709]|nr:hypothetical protein GM3709_1419 [Geminocystis sp. NIES-3709]
MPLLYRNLNNICSQNIPKNIIKYLRKSFLENSKRNLILTNELFKILNQLKEINIKAIPYKGTILANSIYGKLSLRQVYDLDLIIDKKDLIKTEKLLLSQGYYIKEKLDQEESFFREEDQIEIDVHWELTPIYFPLKFDFNYFWKNTNNIDINGKFFLNLSPENLLFILCIQIAKDCWERRQKIEYLAKVCDIAQLIYTYPNLDWSQVLAQGKNQDAQRIIHFGLFLAKDLFDISLPLPILQEVERDSVAISLAYQVCADLFSKEDHEPSPIKNSFWDVKLRIRQLVFYLKLRKSIKYRISYFFEILKLVFSQKKLKS